MAFGIESIGIVFDKFFDFILYGMFVPILVLFYVAIFFIMQYYLIKGYIFLGGKGYELGLKILSLYKMRKARVEEKLF